MSKTDIKAINKALSELTHAAIQESWDQGIPVTFLKGEYIVRMYPDGSYDILKKWKPFVKPEKMIYDLNFDQEFKF